MLQYEAPERGSLKMRITKVDSPTFLGPFGKFEKVSKNSSRISSARWRDGADSCATNSIMYCQTSWLRYVKEKDGKKELWSSWRGTTCYRCPARLGSRIIRRPVCNMCLLEDRFRELEWQAISCGSLTLVRTRSKWPWKARELAKLLEKRERWGSSNL